MERKEENVKNIRKKKVISLWKRPGRAWVQRRNTARLFMKLVTVELQEWERTTKCLSTAMCLLVWDFIIIFYLSMQIFKIIWLPVAYFLLLRWSALNNIFPVFLWFCSLFPSRWEAQQDYGLASFNDIKAHDWLFSNQDMVSLATSFTIFCFLVCIFSTKKYKLVYID